jgi:HK97 family phage portal protein
MPEIARRGLLQRVMAALAVLRASPGSVGPVGQWFWPTGHGDRGPPGSWQMNRNDRMMGQELVAFSAVYACINTISTDIAKLPVQVFSKDLTTGALTPRRADYYVQLMGAPNQFQTLPDFLFSFVQSYLFQGNTYCYCRRNARGEVSEMHVLNPYRVQPLIASDGSIYYRCGEDFLAGLGVSEVVPERDMIHHRLPLLPGYPLVGVTPIFAAAASSAVGLKILQNSQTFFANSSRPSGMLVTDRPVQEAQATRIKQEWDEAYRGDQFGKIAVLSNGFKWEPLTITAQDAQLIEQLRWSVEDVARVFRVPPFMLGDMTKVSYRNTEQLSRAYLNGCLSSHVAAIEQRFARAFEFGPQFVFQFDLSALLRTEIDVRFGAYEKALNSGWQSINDVRAQEGLTPVKGGEVPRVQMQYVPIDAPPLPATSPIGPGPGDPPVPGDDDPAPAPDPTEAAADIARVRAAVRQRLRRAA